MAQMKILYPDCTVKLMAYMDDVTVVGPYEQVAHCVGIFEEKIKALGLSLNRKKCCFFDNGMHDIVPVGLPSEFSRSHDGVMVLGAPIGNDPYVSQSCGRILADLDSKFSAVDTLENGQVQHLLTRLCCIPTVTFLPRVVEPRLFMPFAKACDAFIKRYLEMLLSWGTLEGHPWNQAILPIRLGGLGLRLPSLTTQAAFLGSWATCWLRVMEDPHVVAFLDSLPDRGSSIPFAKSLEQAYASLCSLPVPRGIRAEERLPADLNSVLGSGKRVQQYFTKALEEDRYNKLLESMDPPDRARLLSCAGPGASGWLTAIPYNSSLTLSNEEFSTAVLLRLGLPIPLCAGPTTCVCKSPMDPHGHHALSCTTGGWLQIRHNQLRETWIDILTRAGLSTHREVFVDSGKHPRIPRLDPVSHLSSAGVSVIPTAVPITMTVDPVVLGLESEELMATDITTRFDHSDKDPPHDHDVVASAQADDSRSQRNPTEANDSRGEGTIGGFVTTPTTATFDSQSSDSTPAATEFNLVKADIMVSGFPDGKTLLLDVTVTSDRLQRVGSVPTGREQQAQSAHRAERRKNCTYGADARQMTGNGFMFEPLVFESFGLMGERNILLLRKTALFAATHSNSAQRHSGAFPAMAQSFEHTALQRLSVCLQKWNAQLICRKASQGRAQQSASSCFRRRPAFNPNVIRNIGAAGH